MTTDSVCMSDYGIVFIKITENMSDYGICARRRSAGRSTQLNFSFGHARDFRTQTNPVRSRSSAHRSLLASKKERESERDGW